MIKFEHTDVWGFEHAIRGMRNPMESWGKSDSFTCDQSYCQKESSCPMFKIYEDGFWCCKSNYDYIIGNNDLDLMQRLIKAGSDHRKFMRQIMVSVDITAPLYWWKEFDTYKVGTVANSCSTMHCIHKNEFTIEDFSCEHLIDDDLAVACGSEWVMPTDIMEIIIDKLNLCRKRYLETKDKKYWWQMIQLLPSSYNQKRTVTLNYEVLRNIYFARRDHKLDEWSENIMIIEGQEFSQLNAYESFCDWIEALPYAKELITLEDK